jgi:hypothetical protein
MPSGGLYRSEAITEFASALKLFRSSVIGMPETVLRRIARTRDLLQSSRACAERARDCARSLLEVDDEDDGSRRELAKRDFYDAERRIAEIAGLGLRLDRTSGDIHSALGRWAEVMDQMIPRNVARLGQTASAADEYLSGSLSALPELPVTPGEPIPWSRPALGNTAPDNPNSSHQAVLTATIHPEEARSPSELPPLPEGFEWFPIAEIPISETPSAADPPKGVAESVIRACMESHWSELMRLMLAYPQNTREACEKFDVANNRVDRQGFVHPKSLAALYGYFFVKRSFDHIRIVAANNRAPCVDNGRHRIKLARDLAWRYIPAEVIRKKEGP